MTSTHTPVIVGVGQITEKDVPPETARSPLRLMHDAVLQAAADAGITAVALGAADQVMVTTPFTDDGMNDPAGCLADSLGAELAVGLMSGFGGSSPQCMLAHAAGLIADGRARLVVLAGAEAQRTKLDAGRRGVTLRWRAETKRPASAQFSAIGPADGASPEEHAHRLSVPAYVYPLFENALRHHYRRSMEDHRQALGRLMSRFSRVAVDNPCAWFRTLRTPEEIITPSPANRNIALPYTKMMNAMLMVNQSAAIIMTSEAEAQRLGVSGGQMVYIHGYAEAADHWQVLTREDYHSSPAIRSIADTLSADTGWTPAEMDFFDLYSCFPSAVQITRDMFGISQDDDRYLTVTGGLPYFGGPGNNYVMHAIAEMAETLRKHPGRRGLVTGNSFYLTRHCAAIYSTASASGARWRSGLTACQQAVDCRPRPEIAADPTGVGRIETYTVIFDQNGRPEMGLLIGRTEDDQRFAAYTPKDMDLLTAMTSEDFYGVRGNVTREGMVNTFVPL